MKILVAIANHGTKNMKFLTTIINEYRSMHYCTDIVVFSNIHKELGGDVEVRVGLPWKNPWSLPFAHKQLFADRINDYDLFIYSEDDTLITEDNIRAFLEVTDILPDNEIAGFLRYELDDMGRKYYSTVHSHFHWIPGSVRSINNYSFARFTNDHSACYILTRRQLERAIDSGGFLVEPHDERYDLLVTAATDPYTQCGLSKVICISHLKGFEIHHLPNVYIGKLGLAEADFQLQISTMLRHTNGRTSNVLFPITTKLRQEQFSKSYYEERRDDIIDLVPASEMAILSVGCGSGVTEEALLHRGHSVHVIPLDSIIGSCALAKGLQVLLPDFLGSYEMIGDKRFDCIIFSDILQHLSDPVRILKLYKGLLKNSGCMIISVPNFSNIKIRRRLSSEGISQLNRGSFEKTGLHLTTQSMVLDWIKQSDMRIHRIKHAFEGKAKRAVKVTPSFLWNTIATRHLIVSVNQITHSKHE